MKTSTKEELLRAEALERYEVIGAPPDPALEEISSLAAEICGTATAGIALVGSDAVYVHSRVGPGPSRMPRGRTPDETTIYGDVVYEIADARYHKDYRPDGILAGGRTFRFYAGAPLITPSGMAIGTLFVQDAMPHSLTDLQKRTLLTLAHQVIARFELNARIRIMDREGRVRQRVESALTIERNFVSTVLDTVGALVAVFDMAGRIVRFNRACEEASGYEFASLVGRFLWEKLIPAEDVAAAIEDFDQLRRGNFPASFENYWRHRDGSRRRIAWSATGLVDHQGVTTFMIFTGIDVSEQRAAEGTLRESEARYRQLVEGSLGMVCTHDLNGVLLSVNTHGAASLGRSVEEMTGQNLAAFMPAERRNEMPGYLRAILRTAEAQGRLHILHPDGHIRVIAFRNKLIEMPGREPYVLGFGIDISDQVRAEEKLRALIHESNSILESIGDGIFGVDLAGLVTVVNPAAAEMLGYEPTELLGRNFHDVVLHTRADGSPYPADQSPILGTVRDLATVRISHEVFWRKDGTSFPVEYVARPQIDTGSETASSADPGNEFTPGSASAGRAIGVVVAFTDTTERRQLDRMKDEFVSTVSHELRTPLTSLRAALGLVTGGALASRPEKMQQMLEIAVSNTDRLIRLVNDILDIERISSGNAELHAQVCSCRTLLERIVAQQQASSLSSSLRFTIHAEGSVWGDPDRILQALSNLVSNAAKYSPPDGEITLTAYRSGPNEMQFDIHDQGRGIPADKLETIFERFQQVDASDSRSKGGTGLGLAICRSIITQHGGRIWASSSPGAGATFHFTLPIQAPTHLR